MSKYNIAILGAGHIANAMAEALNGLKEKVNCYAVASRTKSKAEDFANRWGFEHTYGSYEELVNDPNVDLIYIATPHSHHYEHAKLCVEHGKPVLVEKAFTANAIQTEELIALAEERKVFIAEAMWTRYIPARKIVEDILRSGVLGEITHLEADFSIPLTHIERLREPELAGGALLDLGVYALTFSSMYFGDGFAKMETTCEKYETGVDATSKTTYTFPNGKKSIMKTSFVSGPKNEGEIFGSKGSLYVRELNNYKQITRRDVDGNDVEDYPIPEQINGYEYEVLACIKALEQGKLECDEMPHQETLEIMRQMDALRKEWGVAYPFE